MYIQSDGDLAMLVLNNNEKIYEIKPLKDFEEELKDFGFIRINRSVVVNRKYVSEVDTKVRKRNLYIGEIEFKIAKSRLKYFRD
jgi:DNA-binding LytR/AlgR family response regulator